MKKADEIRAKLRSATRHNWSIPKPVEDAPAVNLNVGSTKLSSPPEYKLGDKVATRAAYGTTDVSMRMTCTQWSIAGNALLKLADTNKRVISLDGDMKNSTFSEKVAKKYPEQFVECFIAEQNVRLAATVSARYASLDGRCWRRIRMPCACHSLRQVRRSAYVRIPTA